MRGERHFAAPLSKDKNAVSIRRKALKIPLLPLPFWEGFFLMEKVDLRLTKTVVLAIIIKQSFFGNRDLRVCWNW